MAASFSKIVDLPPLRVTVQELAERAEELSAQMSSGGRVDVTYDVSFEDGTSFTRHSSSDFLANLDRDGERLAGVELRISAWTSPPPGNDWGGDIAKSVSVRLRDFGSEIWVASTDPIWGKGAIDMIKARFSRYSPWYARLHGAVPFTSGALTPLPFAFIFVAVVFERRVTALLAVVVILSSLLLIGNRWFWRQYMKRRLLAHTVIFRRPSQKGWPWAKLLVGATALAADVATLVVILLR